jgi:hypothetical protein
MEGSMSKMVSALAAGILTLAASGAAHAQQDVTVRLGVMNWQGNAAQVPVEVVNTTGAPMRPSEMTCEFIAIGRVVGTDRQRVPPLAPGDRVTVNVMSDTGGQLVDSVRCQLL